MFSKSYIEVNGVEHFVIEYEAGEDKPVILYVHGGPGLAETIVIHELQAYTCDTVNLFMYDQRGAGRTFFKSPDGLVEYDQIEADLAEVVNYVYSKYNKKIFLMGHNWGTVPAIRYARNNPDKIQAYIGYQQVVDMTTIAKVRMARVKELAMKAGKKGDAKKVDKFAAISGGTFDRDKYDKKQITKLNVLLTKYNVASGTDKDLMRRLPKSPFYDLPDLRVMMNAPKLSFKLTQYLRQVNLYNEETEFEVPVLFVSGDWDYNYPWTMVQEYLDRIKAPLKEMALIKDTGPDVMYTDGKEFWCEVLKFIEKNV